MEIAKRLVSLGNKLIIITESSLEVYSEGNKPILFEIIDNIEVYRIPVEKNESSKNGLSGDGCGRISKFGIMLIFCTFMMFFLVFAVSIIKFI